MVQEEEGMASWAVAEKARPANPPHWEVKVKQNASCEIKAMHGHAAAEYRG